MAKHKVAERQIARILALVEHEALSAIEISARLFLSVTSVGRFVARLLAEPLRARRLYIAGWRDGVPINRPTRLLRAGCQRDVEYVPMAKRKGRNPLHVEADRKRAEILELLVMPQTSQQLAARVGLTPNRVNDILRQYRAAGQVHIKAWMLPVYRGSQSAVYALGNLPDKPRVRDARRKSRTARPSAFAPAIGALMGMQP
ncbi:hypothetical protein [Massilia sp. HP4]|uniref:hypothetical protein n=1 Tax=Massilia sp. HP4 TaxID=2562316 RepID=UPI0010BFF6EA|nr:hypothetical protein [Massilia sp. HP4]